MSLINIKQLRNLPSADVGATIVYNGTNNVWSNIDASGIQISSGTSLERPTTPAPGLIRFNSDLNQMEYWNGSQWVQIFEGTRKFVQSFVQGDLVSNILTVTHNLNDDWCSVTVYDNTRQIVIPTAIISVNANVVEIDLTAFVTISGTWRAVIVGG